MSGNNNRARALGLVVAIAALAGACENSSVIAPKDATMTLAANPAQVTFSTTDDHKTVALSAQVLASGGFPQAGVAVTFSTNAPTDTARLASNGQPVNTNSDSTARDTLTLLPDAPTSIDVTATSGSLSQKVTITKSVGSAVPSDGSITLNAAPTSVLFDLEKPETLVATVGITATVLNKSGGPVPAGAIVHFATSIGTLDNAVVSTNSSGIAQANLTLQYNEPGTQANVTATAPPLSSSVTILKTVNHPPVAQFVADPPATQVCNHAVTFNGTGSNDPDLGQTITFYKWTITNNEDGTFSTEEGASDSILARTFSQAQTLTVKLEVTDDPTARGGPTQFYPSSRQLSYIITCPVAAATVPAAGAGVGSRR